VCSTLFWDLPPTEKAKLNSRFSFLPRSALHATFAHVGRYPSGTLIIAVNWSSAQASSSSLSLETQPWPTSMNCVGGGSTSSAA
jgi:hypothetical protein